MTLNLGERVYGMIVTPDSEDTFPTQNPATGLGGWYSVADMAARDNIFQPRRADGMKVRLRSDGTEWVLGPDKSNESWSEYLSGNAAIVGILATLAAAPGANLIGIADAQALLAANTVEGAIEEIARKVIPFATKALFNAVLAGLADDVYSVLADESVPGSPPTRYSVAAGVATRIFIGVVYKTTAQLAAITPIAGQQLVNSDTRAIVEGDGATPGGIPGGAGNQVIPTSIFSSKAVFVAAVDSIAGGYYQIATGDYRIGGKDGGTFRRDQTDTTSAEDGGAFCGTVIRTSDYATRGVFKRQTNEPHHPFWFGAKGDASITNDSDAIERCLASGAGKEIYFGYWKYYLTRGDLRVYPETTLRKGKMRAQFSIDMPNSGGLLAQTIFCTRSIPNGESDSDITFEGMRCESVGGAGLAGSNLFLFQAYSNVIVSGRPSFFVSGRTDGFSMFDCHAKNMKLTVGMGDDWTVDDCTGRNFVPWTQQGTRHVCIFANHYVSDSVDVSHLDTNPSNFSITNSKVFFYGGGICCHTLFNVNYPERRIMSGVCADNQVIGRSVAEEAADPNKKAAVFNIYYASLKRIQSSGNITKNGTDMCIDCEYCEDVSFTGDKAENGGFKFFWGDTNNIEINGITSRVSEVGYDTILGFTGTIAIKKHYSIKGCFFYNDIPTLSNAKINFGTGTNGLFYVGNHHWDVALAQDPQATHFDSTIEDNHWIVTVDRDLIPSPTAVVSLATSGYLKFNRNSIKTDPLDGVVQGANSLALELIGRRLTISTGTYDPKDMVAEKNVITGFPKSIRVASSGSTAATWMASLIRNEYDGTLDNALTSATNRLYIERNYKKVAGQMLAADPATPPIIGTYAKSSTIGIWSTRTGAAAEAAGYFCSASAANTGGTWKTELAPY